MKKFKVGQKIINDVDYSVGTHHGWSKEVNWPDWEEVKAWNNDGIKGVIQTVIEIDGDEIITDFVTSDGKNYWFEADSPIAKDFEIYNKNKIS